MKKAFLLFVILFGILLVGCGGEPSDSGEEKDGTGEKKEPRYGPRHLHRGFLSLSCRLSKQNRAPRSWKDGFRPYVPNDSAV